MCYCRSKRKEPWQIAAARFCVERREFTHKELETFLTECPNEVPIEHIRNFFIENIKNPAGRQFDREFRKSAEGEGGYWTAPPELVSMVIDFDELREARKSSGNAMKTAIGSLIVASLIGIAQILVQIYSIKL